MENSWLFSEQEGKSKHNALNQQLLFLSCMCEPTFGARERETSKLLGQKFNILDIVQILNQFSLVSLLLFYH